MLKAFIERALAAFAALERLEWLPRLVVRVGMGLMFAGGAVRKAQTLDDFVAYFQSLGIPAPALQAPFVIAVELLGGLALIAGLGTRVAAFLLSGTMVVAIATAALKEHNIHANWKGLLEFLYLPEWLLLCLLGWLVVVGAGRVSLDRGLRERFEREARGGRPAVKA